MRPILLFLLATTFPLHAAEDTKRASNTIVLDETGVKNLRIETVEVEEADFETTLFSLGRIQAIPGKIADLSSRIAGRIVELRVAPGDTVKEGDDIVKVESRQPGDPPPTITLKAPISGLVTQVNQHPGAPIEPSNAVLEITDLTEVYAVARVPEHQAGQMKPGTKAHIKVAALPNEKFEGELLRFGTSADRQSGTLDAIFRLPNTGGQLRAEMRAEFSIVMSKREGVVAVPRSALQGEGGNRFVYVKDFDLKNAFIKSPVTVGEINDRYVEITNGLLPADEVVTRGAYSLSFAGASAISLKEALDAAHGHEHAEDGSELTPEKLAEMKAKKSGTPHHHEDENEEGHDHDHDHESATTAPQSPIWKYTTALLSVLLLISLLTRRPPHTDEHDHSEQRT